MIYLIKKINVNTLLVLISSAKAGSLFDKTKEHIVTDITVKTIQQITPFKKEITYLHNPIYLVEKNIKIAYNKMIRINQLFIWSKIYE